MWKLGESSKRSSRRTHLDFTPVLQYFLDLSVGIIDAAQLLPEFKGWCSEKGYRTHSRGNVPQVLRTVMHTVLENTGVRVRVPVYMKTCIPPSTHSTTYFMFPITVIAADFHFEPRKHRQAVPSCFIYSIGFYFHLKDNSKTQMTPPWRSNGEIGAYAPPS